MIQNIIMTVALFPISMIGVGIYMKLFGPFEKSFYWWTVLVAYIVMLLVCWGVETGLLYKIFAR